MKKISNFNIRPILFVIVCTFLTTVGQILLKYASFRLHSFSDIFTNYYLFIGFFVYGVSAVLLIVALRSGELSVLYPFIALGFIWVTLFSIFLFNEHVSLFNWIGMFAIIFGVSLIGYGGSK